MRDRRGFIRGLCVQYRAQLSDGRCLSPAVCLKAAWATCPQTPLLAHAQGTRARASMVRASIGDIMLTAATLLICLVVTCAPAFANQATCHHLAQQAEKAQSFFSPVVGYQVSGTGRLYF